ncbi:hypothetical protein ACWD4G_11915 [Streptomyces sp. NPDC002643]
MSFVTYYPGRATLRERAYTEGAVTGEAKGILRVLEVRGIPVSDEVRTRITTCTDLARVDGWLDRAGTVERAEDLFTDEPPAESPKAIENPQVIEGSSDGATA